MKNKTENAFQILDRDNQKQSRPTILTSRTAISVKLGKTGRVKSQDSQVEVLDLK